MSDADRRAMFAKWNAEGGDKDDGGDGALTPEGAAQVGASPRRTIATVAEGVARGPRADARDGVALVR